MSIWYKKYHKFALAVFFMVSMLLVFFATQVRVSTDFKKLLPLDHPFLMNMMEHKDDLTLGNDIRIVVEASGDTIIDAEYLSWLQTLTNKLYELPGVDKSNIKSLWSPSARWIAVTEDGFQGGEIIPPDYDGSPAALQAVRQNILRSAEVGRLVADNFQSTSIYVPLVWDNSSQMDYKSLNTAVETLRHASRKQGYEFRVIGVAKKIGDLIAGAQQMILFFVAAVVFLFLALVFYTTSVQVALVLCLSGLLGVTWQLGIVALLGKFFNMGLDPYSMLVPFLIFAIAISHGLQLYNGAVNQGLSQDDPCFSGLKSFLALRKPAVLALVSDAIGFATLAIIPIEAIRDLAIAASMGVVCLLMTTLIFVPLMIDLLGVSDRFAQKCKARSQANPAWIKLSCWASKGLGRWCVAAVFFLILVIGVWLSQDLQVGDLRPGAPELRADAQYNQDIEFFVSNYSQSVDVYVVLVRTPPDQCNTPVTLQAIDELQWQLSQVAGVQNSMSLVDGVQKVQQALNEGFPKWAHVPMDQTAINGTTANLPSGLMNLDCSFTPIYVFLDDHKAQTLANVTSVLEAYDRTLFGELRMLPAAGNAGIEAAVNQSIQKQQWLMLIVIYTVVASLCWLTFRRIRVVVAIFTPLAMTSLLCQALMASLDIGIKVSTLPVIALGVGIGVDYGVYICARYLKDGDLLKTLQDTGQVVAFTGLALAISVGTWMFSAVQFQADMGTLLTFMFIWNMVGALLLLPILLKSQLRPPIAPVAHSSID